MSELSGSKKAPLVRLQWVVDGLESVTNVSEPIPLCATLGVHVVNVIVSKVLKESFDLMLEHLSFEYRLARYIQREIDGNNFACLDPFYSFQNSSRSQKIDPAKL